MKRSRKDLDAEDMFGQYDRHGNPVSKTLFIDRLPHDITEEEIEKLFKRFHGLSAVKLGRKELKSGEFRTCTVEFTEPEHAASARKALQHHKEKDWPEKMIINFVKPKRVFDALGNAVPNGTSAATTGSAAVLSSPDAPLLQLTGRIPQPGLWEPTASLSSVDNVYVPYPALGLNESSVRFAPPPSSLGQSVDHFGREPFGGLTSVPHASSVQGFHPMGSGLGHATSASLQRLQALPTLPQLHHMDLFSSPHLVKGFGHLPATPPQSLAAGLQPSLQPSLPPALPPSAFTEVDRLGNPPCSTLFVSNFEPTVTVEQVRKMFPLATQVSLSKKELHAGELRSCFITFPDLATAISERHRMTMYIDKVQKRPLVVNYSKQAADQRRDQLGVGMGGGVPTHGAGALRGNPDRFGRNPYGIQAAPPMQHDAGVVDRRVPFLHRIF
ncbi:hypothetical protein CBR_g19317 [Chara braunii]|uniref:RRM domain-containing protein n=1 Tax=Chara braunii TaxID=69332 RepID=A0A388KXM1_CHABU|nr:hypothetical protein CBR_g19317 [Chara braunii]|eukprot:GBG74806.1 hypothetical protein CBR_g19317 [Chara braunii]